MANRTTFTFHPQIFRHVSKFIRASQSNGNMDQSSNDDVDNDSDDTNLIRGLGRANTSSIIGGTRGDGNSSHPWDVFHHQNTLAIVSRRQVINSVFEQKRKKETTKLITTKQTK